MAKIMTVHTGGNVGDVIVHPRVTGPTYVLPCDGSAVSRTTYAALFAKIGITHGQGDGSTTFNVPDYRGRTLRHVDSGAGRDPDAGSRTAMNTGGNTGDNVGSVQGHAFNSHNHGGATGSHDHTFTKNGNAGAVNTGITVPGTGGVDFNSNNDGSPYHVISNTAPISSDGGNETRMINANTKYWIVWK